MVSSARKGRCLVNRRGFLKLFGTGIAAVAVVHSIPASLIPEAAPVAAPIAPAFEHVGFRGLPYIVNNTGCYFGVTRNAFPSVDMGEFFPEPTCEVLSVPKDWRPLVPEDYRRSKAV